MFGGSGGTGGAARPSSLGAPGPVCHFPYPAFVGLGRSGQEDLGTESCAGGVSIPAS